jgi:cytochrome c peroxidase
MFFKSNIKCHLLLIIILINYSCIKKEIPKSNSENNETDEPYIYNAPTYYPKLVYPTASYPTKFRFLLGKKLFYDKLLAKDFSVSCASCHLQELAFAENKEFSTGFNGEIGTRNSPSLSNVGYNASFFWDGGVPSLEAQAFAPLDNHKEFNMPYDSLILRLNARKEYSDFFKKAFNDEPNLNNYSIALAIFQRALISGNSKFDKYYYQGDTTVLTSSEKNGYALFSSTVTGCNNCHSGFNFTNNSFQNNGLYLNYADQGRYLVTGFITDFAKFKVPSLRNVELTKPYIHDGSLKNLEEVINHYNSGGAAHQSKSIHVKPLNLNPQQKTDLINFLKTLTDEEFINNKEFKP